jgi:hypothetical protein
MVSRLQLSGPSVLMSQDLLRQSGGTLELDMSVQPKRRSTAAQHSHENALFSIGQSAFTLITHGRSIHQVYTPTLRPPCVRHGAGGTNLCGHSLVHPRISPSLLPRSVSLSDQEKSRIVQSTQRLGGVNAGNRNHLAVLRSTRTKTYSSTGLCSRLHITSPPLLLCSLYIARRAYRWASLPASGVR